MSHMIMIIVLLHKLASCNWASSSGVGWGGGASPPKHPPPPKKRKKKRGGKGRERERVEGGRERKGGHVYMFVSSLKTFATLSAMK